MHDHVKRVDDRKYCNCYPLRGSYSRVKFDREVKQEEAEAVFYAVLNRIPGAPKVLEETIHCSDCKLELAKH